MPKNRVTKKSASKNLKLKLNKESLQPVADGALRDIGGAAPPSCSPCVWPSTEHPSCPPQPKCTSSGCY